MARFPVLDASRPPNSAAGRLSFMVEGKRRVGSGTLISPRHVLTAAHNVPAPAERKSMVFVPGDDGMRPPVHGMAGVSAVRMFDAWLEEHDPAWDVALLTLDGALGQSAGFLAMDTASDADLLGAPVHLLGYPPKTLQVQMLRGDGTVIQVGSGLLTHTIPASVGDSGAGLWGHGEPRLVGMHVRDGTKAVRLRAELVKQIHAWI